MTGAIVSNQAARRLFGALSSLRQAEWTRKGLAYAIACAVNLALIGAVLFMSPPPNAKPDIAARSEIVSVSIITAAQDAAPAEAAPVIERPVAAAAPRSESAERETAPSQRPARPEAETDSAAEPPLQSVAPAPQVRSGAAVAVFETPTSQAAPDPAARSALRSLVCVQRLGREHANPGCGEAVPGFSWAAHIDPVATAQVEQQIETHLAGLGVLFGHSAGAWPTGPYRAGNAALAAPSRSLPASDSMRDRLPPGTPDPAFGD
jgi:hypothetical protein